MSGCREQASMTILYLEWGGAETQLISLARAEPEHLQRVISLWAALPRVSNGFNVPLTGVQANTA